MSSTDRFRPNLSGDPQALGRELTRCTQLTLRTARTHGWSNEASQNALDNMVHTVNSVVAARGEFGLHIASDFVYLDDTRLRVDSTGYGPMQALIRELTTRGVGSLFVSTHVNREHIIQLVDLLNQSAVGDEETSDQINAALAAAKSPFQVGPVRDMEDLLDQETEQVDRRERCKKAFFKAITVTKAVMSSSHLGKRLELRHAKRVVQNMVDLMMDEEFTLLGLTTLKSHDNYTFYHSVNVCVYSVALGKRIGLNRTQLAELGVAALFHDLGKARIPLDVLRKPGAFTPEEWSVMKTHPQAGVKEMVRMRGLSSLAFKSMLACFEHHLNYNQAPGGYPRLHRPYRPHLIGRIVAIADAFDAMTTKRIYVKKEFTRDKALSYMMSLAGTKFDPVLLRIFANMVGVFPVGSAVRLKSGRVAVVLAGSEDPARCHRPVVRPITDEMGIQRDYPEVDLGKKDLEGDYPDEVLAAVDPETLGIDISKYFI
jgi:HD-GYP domain-containing protein (c-di-GMP phosphodiesterase class II)